MDTGEMLYGIGVVAAELGVSPSLVRKLEIEGKIPRPLRLAGSNYRLYRRSDIETIRTIRAARSTAGAA